MRTRGRVVFSTNKGGFSDMQIKFVIPGPPKGKGRPRFSRMGSFVRAYTPKATANYEELVLLCWRTQSGVRFTQKIPLRMEIRGYFQVPKSLSQRKRAELLGSPHVNKCDCDNLAKIVMDAISGEVFTDDAIISELLVTKYYDENARVEVKIEPCENLQR